MPCSQSPGMPAWDSSQYLRFANERTQPAVDLAARVAVEQPPRVVDLGCGPGNSTAVLARRWPQAEVTGVDSSPAMLATARRDYPAGQWLETDIATWASQAQAPDFPRPDVVFSNAALQWVPGHGTVLPLLFRAVAAGGALAIQVPHNLDAPPQRCLREIAGSATWRDRFRQTPIPWHVEPTGFYHDVLAPQASRIDLWLTEYVHVLEGPEAIVEWYRGTGLRPFLEQLPDEAARTEFLREYLAAITPHFPRQADGRVLMPFRRLFVVAYR